MKQPQANALWQEFYKVAAQFRDLAPWGWFSDSDIFGVKNPESGEIGWCCIMGELGEHRALAIYRGAKGLDSYYNMSDTGELAPNNPEFLNSALGQDCMMISFEDAAEVSPEQKKHLKSLNMSFRGPGQWIVAETFEPGMVPWLLDEKDLPFAIQCLQQAMTVAYRYEDSPQLLEHDYTLVRTAKKQADGSLAWDDVLIDDEDLPEPEETLPLKPSASFLKKAAAMPRLQSALVLCNFLLMQGIQEKKTERPWFPCMLMGIDPGSGIVLTQDMFPLSELPNKIENGLLTLFEVAKGVPVQLGTHHFPLHDMLKTICEKLDIELVLLSGDEAYFTDLVEAVSAFGMGR